MKKILFLILVALLSFALAMPGFASIPDGMKLPPIPDKLSELHSLIKPQDQIRAGSTMPTPQIKLTMGNDGTYILSNEQISISTEFPFGWFVFTQDYLTQLDLYINMVRDIGGMVTAMQESGQLLYASNSEFDGSYVELYLDQSEMSALFQDLTQQSNLVKEALLEYYQSSYANETVAMETFGDHSYIVIAMNLEKEQMLICQTFYAGIDVTFVAKSASQKFTETELEDFEYILSTVSLNKAS